LRARGARKYDPGDAARRHQPARDEQHVGGGRERLGLPKRLARALVLRIFVGLVALRLGERTEPEARTHDREPRARSHVRPDAGTALRGLLARLRGLGIATSLLGRQSLALG